MDLDNIAKRAGFQIWSPALLAILYISLFAGTTKAANIR